MSLSLLVLCVAVLVARPVFSQNTDCTGGRVYTTCGTPCAVTCENRDNPPLCLTVCTAGCFCPHGTVLHNDQCITPSQCPDAGATNPPPITTQAVTPPPTTCSENKIFQYCGSACPQTCDNYQQVLPCPLSCVAGCFCPHGMVELGDGTCVPPEQCPSTGTTAPPQTTTQAVTPPSTTCLENKIFQYCGTACPRTCDNYQEQFIPCTRQCVAGCFCPHGMVELGDTCIPPQQCPSTETTAPPQNTTQAVTPPSTTCSENKIFQYCGSACPQTCDNYQQVLPCPLLCVQGCFCPHGMVELGDGSCVPPEQCPNAVTTASLAPPSSTTPAVSPPPVCLHGKLFESCGTACPRTCDNYREESIPCIDECVASCFCPHGMVELGDGCVRPEQCPDATTTTSQPSEPTCTNGKIYEQCGTACPLTCANYNGPPVPCPAVCVQGCFCPHGLVQLGDTCVTPESCPDATTTTSEPSEPTCTNGKIYEQCGTACPLTCDNYNGPPIPCPLVCVQGCFCPHGFVQLGDTCVTPESCPDTTPVATTEPQLPTCTAGRVFNRCGTACPLTCDNRDNPPFCTRQCVADCFCPEGTLEDNNGNCVQESECPDKECPDGMEYRECGPLCPYSCNTYFGTDPCFSLRCAPGGCFCPLEHVMADGRCTPAKEACEDSTPTTPAVLKPVRLQVKFRNTPIDDFMTQRDRFLGSVAELLSGQGYGDVEVNVHSVSQEEHLIVILEVSSDGISPAQAEELANLLSEQSGAFTLEIIEVTAVNDESDSDSGVLSTPAIIGIAVGGGVVALVLVVLLSAILVMCTKNRRVDRKYRENSEMVIKNSSPSDSQDYTKGKLVRESLLY